MENKEYLVVGYYDDGEHIKECTENFNDLEEAKDYCESRNHSEKNRYYRWSFQIYEVKPISTYSRDNEWTLFDTQN